VTRMTGGPDTNYREGTGCRARELNPHQPLSSTAGAPSRIRPSCPALTARRSRSPRLFNRTVRDLDKASSSPAALPGLDMIMAAGCEPWSHPCNRRRL
jgi:hypothetical protein